MTRLKWLAAVFFLILALIVISANLGLGAEYFPFIFTVPGLDKAFHFILAGILSILVNLLLRTEKVHVFSLSFPKGNLIVILVAALEEFSQIFLAYRAFSWLDLAANLGGVLAGGWIAGWLQENKKTGD